MAANGYRCTISGSGGVGKTTLLVRFFHGGFIEEYDPTVDDTWRKIVAVEGREIPIEVLDMSYSQDPTLSREAWVDFNEGHMFVYSITDRASFAQVSQDRDELVRLVQREDIPMVLVGSKCDLEAGRVVAISEGEELAKRWGVPFLETSSKTDTNVTKAFGALALAAQRRNPDKLKQAGDAKGGKQQCATM